MLRPELKKCLFVLCLPSILELGLGGEINLLYFAFSGQKRQHVMVLSDKSGNTVYHCSWNV